MAFFGLAAVAAFFFFSLPFLSFFSLSFMIFTFSDCKVRAIANGDVVAGLCSQLFLMTSRQVLRIHYSQYASATLIVLLSILYKWITQMPRSVVRHDLLRSCMSGYVLCLRYCLLLLCYLICIDRSTFVLSIVFPPRYSLNFHVWFVGCLLMCYRFYSYGRIFLIACCKICHCHVIHACEYYYVRFKCDCVLFFFVRGINV